MASNELKPCPFCGGADIEVHGMPALFDAPDTAQCESCSACAPADRWNERAQDFDAMRQRAEAAELDAARYRFVRALENDCFMLNALQVHSLADLDAVIDAALLASGKVQP